MKKEIELNSIGEYLKYVRYRDNFSIQYVSEKTGLSKATISRIENNRSAFFWSVMSLVNFYNIPMDDLKQIVSTLTSR